MEKIGTFSAREKEFNRDRDFAVTRAFKCGGADLIPGELFDKTKVTTRRLRQLYDQRYLEMQGVDVSASPRERRPSYSGEIEFGNNSKVVIPEVEGTTGTPLPQGEGSVVRPPMPRFRATEKKEAAGKSEEPVSTQSKVDAKRINELAEMPRFHDMAEEDLRTYLTANGVQPRPNWSRSRLATRSQNVWQNAKTPKR